MSLNAKVHNTSNQEGLIAVITSDTCTFPNCPQHDKSKEQAQAEIFGVLYTVTGEEETAENRERLSIYMNSVKKLLEDTEGVQNVSPGEDDHINPKHYQFSNGSEVIDITENLTFNGGNAIKYLARATRLDGQNKGAILEDLKKAQWYVEREITRLELSEDIEGESL